MKDLKIVVAMDRGCAIGRDNDLPWHLPDDLKHFKALTSGHTVIMGRRTYESIGRPLPNRRNIVLTRSRRLSADGCEICHSFTDLLSWEGSGEAFVIGGAAIYRSALPHAQQLWITHVFTELADADVFFPVYDATQWQEQSRVSYPKDSRHEYAFDIVRYDRLTPGT